MKSSRDEKKAIVRSVAVTQQSLVVDLVDGRSVSVPITWYPRLVHGSPDERARWELMARGEEVHWPLLDEDIHIVDLMAGRGSKESEKSISEWLRARTSR